MRDAMVFPLYDGGNQGVRRRQLHDILRHPGYDSHARRPRRGPARGPVRIR
jgi:hypothetical protein